MKKRDWLSCVIELKQVRERWRGGVGNRKRGVAQGYQRRARERGERER